MDAPILQQFKTFEVFPLLVFVCMLRLCSHFEVIVNMIHFRFEWPITSTYMSTGT